MCSSDLRMSRRARRAGLVALGALVFAGGCEREGGLHYPRVAANGPTGNCPERAVTQSGPGGYPTHDALRCSYTDAQGKGSSKVHGSVYGEQPGMFPGQPLEAVTVTLHKAESDQSLGKQLGRARTNAQGHFTLAAMLPANYVVVARDSSGIELARTSLVSSDQNPNIPRIQLLVPMDPELRRSQRVQEEGEPQAETKTAKEPTSETDQIGRASCRERV